MLTNTISNAYVTGKRIATQEVTFTKSEDLFMLANLQRQYEDITARIAETTDENIIPRFIAEKARLVLEITAQQTLINGYPA